MNFPNPFKRLKVVYLISPDKGVIYGDHFQLLDIFASNNLKKILRNEEFLLCVMNIHDVLRLLETAVFVTFRCLSLGSMLSASRKPRANVLTQNSTKMRR